MINVILDKTLGGTPTNITAKDTIFRKGGEGAIYLSDDEKYAVKIYYPEKAGPDKRQFLETVMGLGEGLASEDAKFLCWPIGIVREFNNTSCIGCVTRYYPKPPFQEVIDLVLTLKHFHTQYQKDKRVWAKYLQIARGIARSVAALHGRGCSHTDIHYKNFLVNPETAEVVMLDLDGVAVVNFLLSKMGGMPGFIAPERVMDGGRSQPNKRTDCHSLAVLILHTLLFRNPMKSRICYDPDNDDNDNRISYGEKALFSEHPKDFSNRPNNLGLPVMQGGVLSYKILSPELRKLTERALIDGLHNPDVRPSAHEWIVALSCALDELWQCQSCRMQSIYPYWKPHQERTCPFCGELFSAPRPTILTLYNPRNRGNWQPTGRYLILGHGWKLFEDMLDPTRTPPMSRKNEKTVGHIEYDRNTGIYRLINDTGGEWHICLHDGKKIYAKTGQSLPLQPKAMVYFGDGSRLCYVME